MDRAVDATATQERRVRRVDDRIDGEGRDVDVPRLDSGSGNGGHWHDRCMYGRQCKVPAWPPPIPKPPCRRSRALQKRMRARPPADRRLRLDDILKLMVADGLILPADADRIARSRTQRFEHPLELIAEQKLQIAEAAAQDADARAAGRVACRQARRPLPAHRSAEDRPAAPSRQTMSNAYAERYRILPVAVDRTTLTVATAEPFVRSWADELARDPEARDQARLREPASTSGATSASSSISRAR